MTEQKEMPEWIDIDNAWYRGTNRVGVTTKYIRADLTQAPTSEEVQRSLRAFDNIKRTFEGMVNSGMMSHELIDWEWLEIVQKALTANQLPTPQNDTELRRIQDYARVNHCQADLVQIDVVIGGYQAWVRGELPQPPKKEGE